MDYETVDTSSAFRCEEPASTHSLSLNTVGLFSGIGGIERGLEAAGHNTTFLCENDEFASGVLAKSFPGVRLSEDIRDLDSLPKTDLVAAGFPCQDLSMAGKKTGISGSNSGLVDQLFRLLTPAATRPNWLLIENVPYMLHLDKGSAMQYLVAELESLGYTWAYRVVDVRSFGLPQRRQRVILLASLRDDPRPVLLGEDAGASREDKRSEVDPEKAYGFYWTEGLRGLGWAVNAVPPVKGGSGLGIPSPPGIWLPDQGFFGTPEIRDAERLQGFPADWTKTTQETKGGRANFRWRLVGNAVVPRIPQWIGRRLAKPSNYSGPQQPLRTSKWPSAAWGRAGERYEVNVSQWPVAWKYRGLREFLKYPLKPLSARASSGFLERAYRSRIRFPDEFLESLERHRRNTV